METSHLSVADELAWPDLPSPLPSPLPLTAQLADIAARAQREIKARNAALAQLADRDVEVARLKQEVKTVRVEASLAIRTAHDNALLAHQWKDRCDKIEAEVYGTVVYVSSAAVPCRPGSPDLGGGGSARASPGGARDASAAGPAPAPDSGAASRPLPASPLSDGEDPLTALRKAVDRLREEHGSSLALLEELRAAGRALLDGVNSCLPGLHVSAAAEGDAAAAEPARPRPHPPEAAPVPTAPSVLASLRALATALPATIASYRSRTELAAEALLRSKAALDTQRSHADRRSAASAAAAAGAVRSARDEMARELAAARASAHQAEAALRDAQARFEATLGERTRLLHNWEEFASHWESRGRDAEALNAEWETAFDQLQHQFNILQQQQAVQQASQHVAGGRGSRHTTGTESPRLPVRAAVPAPISMPAAAAPPPSLPADAPDAAAARSDASLVDEAGGFSAASGDGVSRGDGEARPGSGASLPFPSAAAAIALHPGEQPRLRSSSKEAVSRYLLSLSSPSPLLSLSSPPPAAGVLQAGHALHPPPPLAPLSPHPGLPVDGSPSTGGGTRFDPGLGPPPSPPVEISSRLRIRERAMALNLNT